MADKSKKAAKKSATQTRVSRSTAIHLTSRRPRGLSPLPTSAHTPTDAHDSAERRKVTTDQTHIRRGDDAAEMTTFVTKMGNELTARVPALDALPRGLLYVRDCYGDYFERIQISFGTSETRAVTITGTPGIGLSAFMAYCFLRYQHDHPENTFVLVSYNSDSAFKQGVMWKNGTTTQLTKKTLRDVMRQLRGDANVVFLLDGPPDVAPSPPLRYVVVTSPCESWFSEIDRKNDHDKMYLPLWDLEELRTAVQTLGFVDALGRMDDMPSFPRECDARYGEEVAYRFAVFGGVARPCLATDAVVVASQLVELQKATTTVDVTTGKAIIDGINDEGLSRHMFHASPGTCVAVADLKIASPYAMKVLSSRVSALDADDRMTVDHLVMEVLDRAMRKKSLLTLLEHGGHIAAHSLGPTPSSSKDELRLTMQKRTPVMATSSSHFGQHLAPGVSFLIPQGRAFQSIDAVCVATGSDSGACELKIGQGGEDFDVVVFQVISLWKDHTDASELHALLQLLKAMGVTAHRIALVFVVPTWRVEHFTRVHVIGAVRESDLFPVVAVNHITVEMSEALQEANIRTVGGLRRLPADVSLKNEHLRVYGQARALLEQHENDAVVTGSANHRLLQQIPQYVMGIE